MKIVIIETLVSLAASYGATTLIIILIVLIPILHHRSLVKGAANTIIDSITPGTKLRDILDRARYTLIGKTILTAVHVFERKHKEWLESSGLVKEKLENINGLVKNEPEEIINILFRFIRGELGRKEFVSKIKRGEVLLTEEDLETIDNLYNGIKFIDELLDTYVYAQEIKNKYHNWCIPLILATIIGILVTPLGLFKFDLGVFLSSILAFSYYAYYSPNINKIKWAEKHIFALKSKSSIREVIRYVIENSRKK